MSSFAGKRKAKVIKVADEDDTAESVSAPSGDTGSSDGEYPKLAFNARLLLMRTKADPCDYRTFQAFIWRESRPKTIQTIWVEEEL